MGAARCWGVGQCGAGNAGGPERELVSRRQAAARAVKAACSVGAHKLAIAWPRAADPERVALEVQALAEGSTLGAYRFDRYLREKKPSRLARVALLRRDAGKPPRALDEAAQLGAPFAAATCLASALVNDPTRQMTPRAPADPPRP